MAVLKYKTRADSNPHGKPKVYFCCHPDDFDLYFNDISEDILAKQNCSIWYLEGKETEYYELFFNDIKQMQLFVIPVTSKLLLSDNCALKIEFPFAIENNIPVLPIMQEPGLEELFNQKFGELQFLDKTRVDNTAINFDRKLEDYLSSVLIGEEMAKKIRAAFDAYIFLSYRKKDRKYANELMRLIHKNDFCRDIAIWYDEFLTPGENFNNSIKAALEKSGLFVLTVTPNIVNEKNYIMTTEYPMAKEKGKSILPIEIVPTDKSELIDKYDDIPSCTNAYDSQKMSDMLLKSINRIALKSNAKTPEHNFFIGLAYLNGIDVEVDHSKAVDLITSAAEQGLPEAMEKLSEMYTMGMAVKYDYSVAAYWLEKVVDFNAGIYNQTPNEDNALGLFEKLYKLSMIYEKLHNFDKAKQIYNQMLKMCEERPNSDVWRSNFALTSSILSEIYKREGEIEKSLELNTKCIKIRESIISNTSLIDESHNLSVNYNRQGQILFSNQKYDEAIYSFEQSLSLRKKILSERGELDDEYGVAVCYLNLADVFIRKSLFKKAEEYYLKSLEIVNKLVNATSRYQFEHWLAITLERLGTLHRNCNRLEDSKRYLFEALEVAEALTEKAPLPGYKRNVSVIYQRIATVFELENNPDEADKFYYKSLGIDEELLNNTKTFEAVEDYSIACAKIARLHAKYGDFEVAFEFFKKGLEVCITNAATPPLVMQRERICLYCNELANVCRVVGEYDLAKKYIDESLKYGEEFINSQGLLILKRQISVSYELLGNINLDLGNFEESKHFWNKKIEFDRRLLIEGDNNPEDINYLSLGLAGMGNVFFAEKNFDFAGKYYEESLHYRKILANIGNVDLVNEYDKIGDLYFEQGVFDIAEKYYKHSLEEALLLNEKSDNVVSQRKISVAYNKLACTYRFSGDIENARLCILEDLRITENIANSLRTPESYNDLAMTLYSLALLEDGKIAIEPLQDAYEIWKDLSESFPEISEYAQNRNDAKQILDTILDTN